jgi:hypothetical protein
MAVVSLVTDAEIGKMLAKVNTINNIIFFIMFKGQFLINAAKGQFKSHPMRFYSC